MMSASYIQQLSRQAARRSAREGVTPLIVEAEDLSSDEILARHIRGIPFIGDRCPRGFKRLNASELLGSRSGCVPFGGPEEGHYIEVDSSGWGSPGEIAMTQDEFYEAVRKIGPGKAYAIVETGQFQCVVGVFQPRR